MRRWLPWVALGVALPALATARTFDWPGGPVVAAVAGSGAAREPAPEPPRLAGAADIRGDEAPGHVHFTFDDGPSHTTTPAILDALARHELGATFFVVGQTFSGSRGLARRNAEVLRAEAAAGHLVGNHTFQHRHLGEATAEELSWQIDRNRLAIEGVLGAGGPRLFRPPYGALSKKGRATVNRLGYTTVMWNIDAGSIRESDSRAIRKHVVGRVVAQGGGVVLLHDRKPATARALPLILDDLEAENCRRLRAGKPPILPVELDFFARDGEGRPLPVPAAVQARAEATRRRLERRCFAVDNPPRTD